MRRLLVFLAAAVVSTPALADPFRGSSAPAAESVAWLPRFLSPLLAWLVPLQHDLIVALQRQIDQLQTGHAPFAAVAIIGTGLLYGVIHAAGPGHGKTLAGSYFSTRQARITQAFLASGAMALVQAVSAIVLVSLFTLVLGFGSGWLLDKAGWVDVGSFGLIGLFGAVITWRSVRRADGEPAACAHGHHHHDHGHDHDHAIPTREFMVGALAVGLRPCTGALLILLFTFANGLYAVGILATLAMAAGTAATVAAISLGAVGISSTLFRIGLTAGSRRSLSIAGGIIITLAGFAMMTAALATAS
jgi:ABC-type nickel/cobalt efflux system permease component RcnA